MTACLVVLCVCLKPFLSYSWQHIPLFAPIRDLSVFYNIVVTVSVSQFGILIRKINNHWMRLNLIDRIIKAEANNTN